VGEHANPRRREKEKPEGTRWRNNGAFIIARSSSVQDERMDLANADKYRRMSIDTFQDRFCTPFRSHQDHRVLPTSTTLCSFRALLLRFIASRALIACDSVEARARGRSTAGEKREIGRFNPVLFRAITRALTTLLARGFPEKSKEEKKTYIANGKGEGEEGGGGGGGG